MVAHPFTEGHLKALARNEEQDASSEYHRRLYRWAARVGFTERQAPYAVVVASAMKFKRQGAPVHPREVRDRLLQSHPWLFVTNAQLTLAEEAL